MTLPCNSRGCTGMIPPRLWKNKRAGANAPALESHLPDSAGCVACLRCPLADNHELPRAHLRIAARAHYCRVHARCQARDRERLDMIARLVALGDDRRVDLLAISAVELHRHLLVLLQAEQDLN